MYEWLSLLLKSARPTYTSISEYVFKDKPEKLAALKVLEDEVYKINKDLGNIWNQEYLSVRQAKVLT